MSNDQGRGVDIHHVVVDEAQNLPADAVAAVVHPAGPNLLARAKKLVDQYDIYVETGEKLIEYLRRFGQDYTAAGLVRKWDDVANDRMSILWDPEGIGPDEFHFHFTDYDGDSGFLTLPFEYLTDPAGCIAELVRQRQVEEQEIERKRLAEEAAARPARIARLRAELAELTHEQEPEQQ